MSMDKKNEYRMVMNAILALPWGEGLARDSYVADGLCCSLGATAYGHLPQSQRYAVNGNLGFIENLSQETFAAILRENDRNHEESPLARKHRMITWLRERADARDRRSK